MKHTYIFGTLALAIATACSTQACNAQSLSNLTPSCAQQAQASLDTGATSGPGSWIAYFYDDASTNALRVEIADTAFSDLNAHGLNLLNDAADSTNRSHSPSARSAARKILNEDTAATSHTSLTPVSVNPDLNEPEFVCFSDACPQGTSCQAFVLTRTGSKLLKDLPNQKRLHRKILRWAQRTGVSKTEIQSLREIHANNLKLFKKTVDQLQGQTIYVSRGVMSKK